MEGPIESFIKKNAAAVKSNSGTKNGDLRPMTARQRVTKDDLLHSEESFVD